MKTDKPEKLLDLSPLENLRVIRESEADDRVAIKISWDSPDYPVDNYVIR